ncbi:hypothetical protein GmHk_01G001011 [Glycine max]|nr:hypothetical protein GmHk_01G001011 [Glycine max]
MTKDAINDHNFATPGLHFPLSSSLPQLLTLIRQVCEVLIFTLLLIQYAGLESHQLSATLLD